MLLFSRGIRLTIHKKPMSQLPITDLPPVDRVYVPLAVGQSVHTPAVEDFDTVLRGQRLGQPDGPDGLPVLSPVVGVLAGLKPFQHPLYGPLQCAVLDCAVSTPEPLAAADLPQSLSPDELIACCREAAILDELDFTPLCDKLAAWRDHGYAALVVNAVEQETFCCSAQAVLKERGGDLLRGLQLAARVLGIPDVRIAVCLKRKQYHRLCDQLGHDVVYQVEGPKYPREFRPPEGVQGPVCTLGAQAGLALFDALAYGLPQLSGVVTVAGDAVERPQNVRVPFGATVEDVLHFCGLKGTPGRIVLGDNMTGTAAPDPFVPILPGMTCVLALADAPAVPEHVCIQCGRCAQVCHARLLPYGISKRLENMQYERLADLHAEECDGCGACSYVCPAGRDVAVRVLEAQEAAGNIFLDWGDEEDE